MSLFPTGATCFNSMWWKPKSSAAGGALTFTELVLPFHANHMGYLDLASLHRFSGLSLFPLFRWFSKKHSFEVWRQNLVEFVEPYLQSMWAHIILSFIRFMCHVQCHGSKATHSVGRSCIGWSLGEPDVKFSPCDSNVKLCLQVKGAKTAVWLHLRISCAPQELPDGDLGVGGLVMACSGCTCGESMGFDVDLTNNI